MLTVHNASVRIARQVSSSEASLDEALIQVTALLHSAAIAQKEFPEAPATRVQSALLHLSKTMTSLVEARGEMLRTHGQLLDIAKEMGATELPECPDYLTKSLIDKQQAA
jgi:IS4 transposase